MGPTARRPGGVAVFHAPAAQRLSGSLPCCTSYSKLQIWRPGVDVKVSGAPAGKTSAVPSSFALDLHYHLRITLFIAPSRSVARCGGASLGSCLASSSWLVALARGITRVTVRFKSVWPFVFHWGCLLRRTSMKHSPHSPVFTELNGVFATVPQRR